MEERAGDRIVEEGLSSLATVRENDTSFTGQAVEDMLEASKAEASSAFPRSRSDIFGAGPPMYRMKLRSYGSKEDDTVSISSNMSRVSPVSKKKGLFGLRRKRRRDSEFDPETTSMSSRLSMVSSMSTASTMTADPRRKKRRLDRFASAVSSKGSSFMHAMKRPRHHVSKMEIVESPCRQPKIQIKEYQTPKSQPSRPKHQRLWVDSVQKPVDSMSKELIKRQEAIYEISEHAQTMYNDMKMIEKNYMTPMEKFQYLDKEERERLFGGVARCSAFSQDVVEKLTLLRSTDDGTVDCIGNTLSLCFPKLKDLIPYCAKLQLAKTLYDRKAALPAVSDFLECCQQSPFSGKRSLWDFLDSQRSGLLKYPLLLKEVIKTTPSDHPDMNGLEKAYEELNHLLAEMDRKTGQVTLQETLRKLSFTHQHKCPLVESSQALLFSGTLKLVSTSHTVQVFLFDKALVVTQPLSSDDLYHVTYQPISTSVLSVDPSTACDGKNTTSSSPKSSLRRTSSNHGHLFRVVRTEDTPEFLPGRHCNTFTFLANDVHNKKAWVDALETAISQAPVPTFYNVKQTPC